VGGQREGSVGTPVESTEHAAVATARNGAGKSILLATKVFFRVVVDHHDDDDFFSVDGVGVREYEGPGEIVKGST
jgi:hypothetical protein